MDEFTELTELEKHRREIEVKLARYLVRIHERIAAGAEMGIWDRRAAQAQKALGAMREA